VIEQDGPVLVTGGIGYVGRELVRRLIARDAQQIHVLDNLACGEHRLAAMARDKFTLHRHDIRDSDAVAGVMKKVAPKLIIHLAAVHYIPSCEAAPGNATSINVAGTVNLLDAAPAGARFVFASTAAVYAPSADPHVEDDSANISPVDIYGFTKLQGEQYLRYYHAQKKVHATIVRLFNVVGPGETNPHLVPSIIRQIAAGTNSIRLGNLFPHRDYIDVSDVADGFLALANAKAESEGPLISNLGTGVTHPVGDVVALIAKASGQIVDVIKDNERVRRTDRPMLKASTERLKAVTDWLPRVPLAAAMQRAWDARHEDGLG
jgi:UDP-glucose 4-epimerase